MSESTKVDSPATGELNSKERTRDKVGLVCVALAWILIFAYGVYIKTV